MLGAALTQCFHPPVDPCSASLSPVGFWPSQVPFLPPNAFWVLQPWHINDF